MATAQPSVLDFETTWLPGEIVMENFPLRSTSTMTLTWKPTEDVPGLFEPASLGKSSPLKWQQ